MACFYNIKVVEKNEFALVLPLKRRTYVADRPIDEDIDCTALEDVVLKIGGTTYPVELGLDGVKTIVPGTLKKGVYDIELTAVYRGSVIRAAYFEAITIVSYNEQSTAEQYIQGSPITLNAAYVIGGTLTDAELAQLKQQYREAIAAAQQAEADAQAAKEAYDRKAEMLDGVALEATSQQILTAVGSAAQQGTDQTATNTAIKELILAEGIEHAHEYAQEIHNIIGDWTNE